MPKLDTKKDKRSRRRPDPTGQVPADDSMEGGEDPSTLTLLEKLSSLEPEDREIACADFAYLVSDPSSNLTAIEHVLKEPLFLKKIIQNLCDPDLNLRVAAAGALRNLTNVGGVEISNRLVETDCMTPITATLLQAHQNVSATKDNDLKQNFSLLTQIIALLINICENNEHAIVLITNSKAILWLISFLKQSQFPEELKIKTGQLVLLLTEENPEIEQQILVSTEHTELLRTLFNNEGEHICLRVLVSGIIYHIRNESTRAAIIKTILPLFTRALDYDAAAALLRIEPQIAAYCKSAVESIEEADQKTHIYDKTDCPEFEDWKLVTQAQQLSLELLANICTEDQQDDMDNDGLYLNIPEDVVNLVTSSGLHQKALVKCNPPPAEIAAFVAKYPKFSGALEQFQKTQQIAVTCIGNMLLILKKLDDAPSLWNLLFGLIREDSSLEFVEAVSTPLWIMLRKFPPLTFTAPQFEVLRRMAAVGTEETKVNVAGLLGTFGQTPQIAPIVTQVGSLLLFQLSDQSGMVVAEALNSIMDIFAEEPYNAAVAELSMMDVLTKCHSTLKEKIRTAGDQYLRDRLEETENNVGRFIEYKRSQFK
eukprot:TRINITY_DN6851_c0_g1_i1.p1 TRINITY_DN6851_c0_g1~~TRINITY_DN6851_c0_g1_i1.p1  ORF type:complete len:595 (+),score=133.23 TRINITY_DN6851_c0_g1_i1:114-1898(+)